ncbi:MAG: agmatine deiminase family protein [Gammaproteobacteria bacterium]|nr:agmatine deiminase family protein [Gammaproteobacteria bacterium]
MTNITKDKTPREMGFRMPAEWERHNAIWLQWPCSHPSAADENDRSYQMLMEKTWMLMAREIHRQTILEILARSDKQRSHIFAAMNYFGFNMTRISIHVTHTVDVWHRDSGPIFVVDDKGGIAITDWNFNGWGSYPEWGEAEAHIPQTVAEILALPVFVAPLVSEGGAIEVNGSGSLMATRSSIINDNRNPEMSQQQVEQALGDYLGVDHFIWLSGAPPEVCENQLGDGTDYHIDIAARFTDKSSVLYAWTEDESDPRYPYLVKHLEELQSATDEDGQALTLLPMQLPAGGVFAIGERLDPALGSGSHFTDASYLNYLVTNHIVLVPAFGNANDVPAQALLAKCFPQHRVIPIPVVSLTAEGGAIHCVTQQQPAV